MAFNITAMLTNLGAASYRLSAEDWTFETDTGLGAFVGGWNYREDVVEDWDGLQLLEVGESEEVTFHAYQLGLTHGNVTGVRFRSEPVRPI